VVNLVPLLNLIKSAESKGAVASQEVPNEYDVVWGGIKPTDRPQSIDHEARYLTEMTVKEVLNWQDSIDPFYMSEASGAYQIMEDTLREIVPVKGITLDHKFNQTTQDILAEVLLERRGLKRWVNREITDEQFGNNIAKEWASFPVMIGPNRGRSYYAGDGLNKAHISPEQVLKVLEECRSNTAKPTPPSIELQNPENGATEIDYIVNRLNKIEELDRKILEAVEKLKSIYCWDGKS
jgi:hypothetical protein